MSWLKKILGTKQEFMKVGVQTDMHSHLLYGIDDGSKSIEESIKLYLSLFEMGYTKFVFTPHIMSDFYRNSPQTIQPVYDNLYKALKNENSSVELSYAAEYYLDENFLSMISNEKKLLTLGNVKNYVLFETSYVNDSPFTNEAIFNLKSLNYIPILAHPERYQYGWDNFKRLEELYERGVLFQLNTASLSGYYGIAAKKLAEKLIDLKMIHMVGSDCHHERHIHALQNAIKTKYYKKVLDLPLLNDTIFK